MLISTFELLLKPQLPNVLPPTVPPAVKNLSRNVIQGYFLTIANLNLSEIVLSLVFTIRLPSTVTVDEFITFFDPSGANIIGAITRDTTGVKFRASVILPPLATGLFILQPNIVTKPELLTELDFEARGYAEVFLSSFSGGLTDVKVQVTPEQRGTFFASTSNILTERGLDQIAYSLPVQNGGLFTLSSGS